MDAFCIKLKSVDGTDEQGIARHAARVRSDKKDLDLHNIISSLVKYVHEIFFVGLTKDKTRSNKNNKVIFLITRIF